MQFPSWWSWHQVTSYKNMIIDWPQVKLHVCTLINSWLMTHSAANKGRSTVNYCQASAFDRPYLSCSDQHDWWVFQEMFFINIFYKFFWTILNLLYWNLNTFTKLTIQVCFLSICSSFTCFVIILRINALSTFLYFSIVCKHTGWVCSLFACCFAITLYINALHILYFLHHKQYKREN